MVKDPFATKIASPRSGEGNAAKGSTFALATAWRSVGDAVGSSRVHVVSRGCGTGEHVKEEGE